MNIELNETEYDSAEAFPAEIPDVLAGDIFTTAVCRFIPLKTGYYLSQSTRINGFALSYYSIKNEVDLTAGVSDSPEIVSLFFMISGTICIHNKRQHLKLTSNMLSLAWLPRGYHAGCSAEAGANTLLCIHLPVSLFQKLVADSPVFSRFTRLYSRGLPFLSTPLGIPGRMQKMLLRLLDYWRHIPLLVFELYKICIDAIALVINEYGRKCKQQHWQQRKRIGLADIGNYIAANISQPGFKELSTAAFYRKMGLSQYQFNKLFLGFYGMSLPALIRKKRMAKAMDLLVQTDLPISDIAERTGYAEFSSFSRAFARSFGHAPSYYRQKKPL